MSVVVFRTGHLGDTVCSIPAFRRVREYFQNFSLTLLCDEPAGGKVASREVAERLGIFDNIITYKSGRGWRTAYDLYKCVRRLNPKILVCLPQVNKSQGALIWQKRFFKFSGVKRLYGFSSPVCQDVWRPNEPARLLQILDIEGITGGVSHYDIPIDKIAAASLRNKLQEIGLVLESPYLVFCGGGKASTQRWPLDRYASVLNKLYINFNLPIIGIGGTSEIDEYKRLIIPLFNKLKFFKYPLDIGELTELLRGANCFIGNDTGPTHLAAAMNIPVIAIMSARNKPGQWDPDVEKRLLFRSRTECEGCWADTCPVGHYECMLSIYAGEVSEKAAEFIRGIV